MSREKTEMGRSDIREHLRGALLRGDRSATGEISRQVPMSELRLFRDELLEELTDQYLSGSCPFCQLTAVAEAACVLAESGPPIVCFGSLAGNSDDTGRNFIRMLLRAWGMPALDLGADVPEERFLCAVVEQKIRFVIVTAFSADDAGAADRLHRAAVRRGIRERFDLLLCGAKVPVEVQKRLQLACTDHRAAAVARWVVRAWRNG